MIRRLLARFGWAVVLTWTPRNRGLYVYCGNRWATGCGWWRISK